MKTCASCGKANNPTRKYCTRCGKLLIIVKDDKPSPTPIPEVKPTTSASEDQYVRSDTVKATTDDVWVRPSQVSRDRVRASSSSSGKSEFEKAKEVFARAEGIGFEEPTGSGVIEPRMLRASEVRELMGEGAVISQEPAPPAQPEPRVIPTPAPAIVPTPAPTLPPASPAPSQVNSSPPLVAEPTPSPTPIPAATPVPPVETAPPTAPVITPTKPIAPVPMAPSASSINLDARVPEIEDILSHVTEPEDLQDSKIKDLVASLTTQHAEHRKVKEDLANVSARLDEFVRSCQNDSEVKRIYYESLSDQERFARQEYESAKKEYERVDKRRKKEVSALEDRVKNVERNISKSQDSVMKRISELDKVREKIAELQTGGS